MFLDAFLCQIEYLVNVTMESKDPESEQTKRDTTILNEVVDKNIDLVYKINCDEELEAAEAKDDSNIILANDAAKMGSEFMHEALLMKIQVLSQTQKT